MNILILLILALQSSANANYQGCDGNQQYILDSVNTSLKNQVSAITSDIPKYDLEYVKNQFLIPENRPQSSIKDLKYQRYQRGLYGVFSKMNSELQRGVQYACKDSIRERQCKNGEVIAYVLFIGNQPLKTLYLCSGYFNSSLSDQIQTAQHELSHYAAATDDLAMSWMDFKNPDLDLAFTDAYHIENFETGDVERTLKRQIWYWNWPKAP